MSNRIWRVMVVDQHEEVRQSLEYALKSYGYDVIVCGKGYEALDQLSRNTCEFVITDFILPDMNGLEFTNLLRKRIPPTVIIGISDEDVSEDFLLAGANDFRQKPFIPYEIAMMIDGLDMHDSASA